MKILKTTLTLTLIIEVAIIFLFAKFVNRTFMESFFLGSLAIFGITWLFLVNYPPLKC